MIKQETAKAIFNCYAEITVSEKLLASIEDIEKLIDEERTRSSYKHEELTECYPRYQLSVPTSNDSSFRLFRINPSMAKAVITAHLASQKASLAELNQIAKLESETE